MIIETESLVNGENMQMINTEFKIHASVPFC